MDRLRACQQDKNVSSSLRGFHRSRIDADFAMHARAEWRAAFDAWREDHAVEIAEVEQSVSRVRENYRKMAILLADQLTPEEYRE
jgi:hypothetical protein